MSAAVAVVDIGSNSIKVLIAQRGTEGHLVGLKWKTVDARISAGIGHEQPRLSDDGMARGLAAIRELLNEAEPLQPARIVMVATSAVRDAVNGREFCERVHKETGQMVRILTGEEEANYIGHGLSCDPTLRGLQDFYLFDLGGGSLECLSFRNRQIAQAVSLPLGCVRMTERCVSDSRQPFALKDHQEIATKTRAELGQSGFHFNLPPHAIAIGTGGTLTTARAILAARRGRTLETSDTILTLSELRELLSYVGRCDLDDRRRLPAMPEARADVLPAALATLITVAESGGLEAYRHSLYNLRWGLADEALKQ